MSKDLEANQEHALLAAQLADRMTASPAPIRLHEPETRTRETPGPGGSSHVGRRVILCATLLNPPILEMAEIIEEHASRTLGAQQ